MIRVALLWLSLLTPGIAAAQTFQVSGAVVDHLTNRPLIHVLVTLTGTAKDAGSISALTEADGRFVFTAVPKGSYRLLAQRRGETPQGFHQDGNYGTLIIVGGATSTDNLIFPLHTNGSIKGTVVDDQGEPVQGAMLQFFLQSVINGELQTNQVRNSNTNSAGEFHLGRLRPGTYFAAATGRPWYSTSGQGRIKGGADLNQTDLVYPVTWYGNTTNGEAASPILLTEGATVSIQIMLHAVPAVHVQIPTGLISSHRGMMPGTSLFARGPAGTRVLLQGVMSSFSGDDKVSQLTGFPAGRYEVSLQPPNEEGEPGQSRTELLDIADGMTLPTPSASQLSVSGQVTFVEGDRPEKLGEISMSGKGHNILTPIGEDGTFSFPHNQLMAGSYILHLNTPAVWIESMTVKGGKRMGERLEVPASGNVVLSIIAATADHLTKLEGVVTGEGGMPAAGAMVLLVPQDLAETKMIRRNQADSDGSFSLSGVVPGRYTVLAIEDSTGLLYKTASVIKPYLAGGVSINVPPPKSELLKVTAQKRITN